MKTNAALQLIKSKPEKKRKPRRKKGVCEVPNGTYLDVDAILRRSEPNHVGKK